MRDATQNEELKENQSTISCNQSSALHHQTALVDWLRDDVSVSNWKLFVFRRASHHFHVDDKSSLSILYTVGIYLLASSAPGGSDSHEVIFIARLPIGVLSDAFIVLASTTSSINVFCPRVGFVALDNWGASDTDAKGTILLIR